MTYDQWKSTDPNEPFAEHEPPTLDKFLKRIEDDIERISSIWEDVRIRGNVRKDYPLLAEAIDKLLGGRNE